jgi:hypothetical protein
MQKVTFRIRIVIIERQREILNTQDSSSLAPLGMTLAQAFKNMIKYYRVPCKNSAAVA